MCVSVCAHAVLRGQLPFGNMERAGTRLTQVAPAGHNACTLTRSGGQGAGKRRHCACSAGGMRASVPRACTDPPPTHPQKKHLRVWYQ